MKLLIPLTQAGGEDVVLSTIQLLRVALIARLLLLLISLIILLVVITLVVVALKPRISTAASMTRTMRAGPRAAVRAMVVLDGLPEVSHYAAIFPQMGSWLLIRSVFWTWQVQYCLKVKFCPLSRPPLTTLVIIPCTGVSHKIISLALTVAALIGRVILLSLHAITLLSLSRSFILTLGVLGTIRVGILNQSYHTRSHVIAVTLEPSQF